MNKFASVIIILFWVKCLVDFSMGNATILDGISLIACFGYIGIKLHVIFPEDKREQGK